VNRSAEAHRNHRRVGSDNLKLQYDIYHMQRMEGELAATIEKLLPRIAHMQLADNPGRNEPGTGEINLPFLLGLSTARLRRLDRLRIQAEAPARSKASAGSRTQRADVEGPEDTS
jgi:hydroxypyruvate isomerase